MSDDRTQLNEMIKFHGHRCWASISGFRMGLVAKAYLCVVGEKHVCILCSGYDR